jgi:prefoldin subunit 5
MPQGSTDDRWEAELRQLRHELSELRQEQKQLATAIQQLVTTFQSLATHLGIASEPYGRKGTRKGSDDSLRGFA